MRSRTVRYRICGKNIFSVHFPKLLEKFQTTRKFSNFWKMLKLRVHYGKFRKVIILQIAIVKQYAIKIPMVGGFV